MSADTDEEPTETVGAKITPTLKRKLRIQAARNNMTMSTYLREILEEHLSDIDE
jgi:predicted DNA-binding protein